jgi:hypothetical protein
MSKITIDILAGGTGLRCWATDETLPDALAALAKEALDRGLTPSAIAITPEERGDSIEWQLILWGD